MKLKARISEKVKGTQGRGRKENSEGMNTAIEHEPHYCVK